MNKQNKIWMGAGAVVLVGVLLYVLWPSAIEAPGTEKSTTNNTNTKEEPFVKAPSAPPVKAPPQQVVVPVKSQHGSYETYSSDKLSYANSGVVVLFFNSAACSGCQTLDKYIDSHLGEIPRDVKILEVDFDANADLKQKYGLMSPHILIQVDASGSRVIQWTGSLTLFDIAGRVIRY